MITVIRFLKLCSWLRYYGYGAMFIKTPFWTVRWLWSLAKFPIGHLAPDAPGYNKLNLDKFPSRYTPEINYIAPSPKAVLITSDKQDGVVGHK